MNCEALDVNVLPALSNAVERLPPLTGHRQITDAYLIARASAPGGVLVTLDRATLALWARDRSSRSHHLKQLALLDEARCSLCGTVCCAWERRAAARKGWPHQLFRCSFRLELHAAVFGAEAGRLTIDLTGYEMPLPLSFKDPPVESAVCEPPLYFPS